MSRHHLVCVIICKANQFFRSLNIFLRTGSENDPTGLMMHKAMRFSLTLLQDSLLVLFGESDVKLQSPMGMHEFETVDLEFCAAQPV